MQDVTLLSLGMGSFVAEIHTPIEHPKTPVATSLRACPERLIDNCPGNYDRIVIARPTRVPDGTNGDGSVRYKTTTGMTLEDVGKGDAVLVILLGWPADGAPIDPDVVEYQVPRASLDAFLAAGLEVAESDDPDEPDDEAAETE